jgi:RecA/RadA recombinase
LPDPEPFTFTEPRARFQDHILDNLLRIPETGILEVAGPAGAGKSNIAYHLAVNERVADMSRSVILISTEGKVPTERLHQIATGRSSTFAPDDIMNGILIHVAESVDHLRAIVQNSLPPLFFARPDSDPPPSLVIIDSIAALFRLEFDRDAAAFRTRLLFDITTTLKWISTTHNTLIVTTNQATANMSGLGFGGNEWVPALGASWANCVNVRAKVGKTQMRHEAGGKLFPIRNLYVEISPIKQDVKGQFYIDDAGVHGI